jgi:hypothetical protein
MVGINDVDVFVGDEKAAEENAATDSTMAPTINIITKAGTPNIIIFFVITICSV